MDPGPRRSQRRCLPVPAPSPRIRSGPRFFLLMPPRLGVHTLLRKHGAMVEGSDVTAQADDGAPEGAGGRSTGPGGVTELRDNTQQR